MSDVEPFVLALIDPAAYADEYPACAIELADTNRDGIPDGADIGLLISLLIGD